MVSLVTVFHLKAESEPGIQDELRNIKQYSTHTLLGISCDLFLNRPSALKLFAKNLCRCFINEWAVSYSANR